MIPYSTAKSSQVFGILATIVFSIMYAGVTQAGVVRDWRVGGDGGTLNAYTYGVGGDFGNSNDAVSIADAMTQAGAASGSLGFGDSSVSVFLVDFAGSSLNDAGLTLFAMWGNGGSIPIFSGAGTWDSQLALTGAGNSSNGNADTFGNGAEAWGVGEYVNVNIDGVDVLGDNYGVFGSQTPIGFAITNVDQAGDYFELFFRQLNGGIQDYELFSKGLGVVHSGIEDDTIELLAVVVPLPAPIFLTGIGLAGLAISRKRIKRLIY